MAISETKSFIKYFFFAFVFIVSFILINTDSIEIFGLFLFFAVNIIFCLFIGKDITDGSISSDGKNMEWTLKYGILIVSMVFSLVSSIIMVMTLVTLQGKFSENNSAIEWSPTDRLNLDNAKILFTTVTTFIGVVALYVYNTPDDVHKFTYNLFDTILNGSSEGVFDAVLTGSFGNFVRVLFPVVIIGLGSALYGRLQMPSLEVNKTPKRIVCDPSNDPALQNFKDSFIKTYWFLFAFLVVILSRPFVEANFNKFGISPSYPLGFKDRSLVFGQNPSISLLSILTFGISNLITETDKITNKENSINDRMKIWLNNPKKEKGNSFYIAICSILLMPVLRWDVIYLLAKYAFGFVGLLYAGFSIRDFRNIPEDDPCLFRLAYIRQLYIAFIVFLIIYYAFNTFTSSAITSVVTKSMRYLVPPVLLVMSSYLVFITNYFMLLAPKLIVQ